MNQPTSSIRVVDNRAAVDNIKCRNVPAKDDHLLLPATVALLDELFSDIGAVQELHVAEGVFLEDVLALHHCVTPGEMLHQCSHLPPPPFLLTLNNMYLLGER